MEETEVGDKGETSEDKNERVYELGYLLVPTISEVDLPVAFGNLKELVSSMGGIAISDDMPKMIPLAYTMSKVLDNLRKKFNNAYFGWMKFTMDSLDVIKLKKKLDLDPNFIRFLILKTVKENTVAAKRFVRSDLSYRKPRPGRSEHIEAITPINKEEIDKEIDALVAA